MARQAPFSPIAITGMHRSGTSMITRGLHDSGLHLIGEDDAELISAAEDNPEGFWENKAIVACNDDLLEATGGAWDDPPDFPPVAVDDPRVSHLADAATAALAALRQHERWGFKDPRVCLTAAYWFDLQPDLKFIVCVRHPLEVALSLKRRNQNSYSLGLSLWERYYASVLEQVPDDRRIVTHYDTFFRDPAGELARLCEFAGLEPSEVSVRTDLRHHDIDVSLEDAGTTERLRSLYADLCRQAGVAPGPTRRTDERRVRRLVLDGAVAQRHADQRQEAIERLQEREAGFRAEVHDLRAELGALRAEKARERADMEARHRQRVRELEVQMAARQAEVAQLKAEGPQITLLREIAAGVRRTEHQVARIDARTDLTSKRIERAAHLVQGGRYGRALRRRLGPLFRRGRTGAAVVTSRSARTARRTAAQAAHRLPSPAQKALRSARYVAGDPRRRAVPAARSAVRRLPPPAQQVVRRTGTRSRVLVLRVRRRFPRMATSGPTSQPPVVAPKAPKGPSPRLWRDAFGALVAATVPRGDTWAVVTAGSPKDVRSATSPAGIEFPPGGKPLPSPLGHVAAVEALRYRGVRWFAVPEGSRGFMNQQLALADHLAGHYRTVADRAGAGVIVDLRRPATAGQRSLGAEVAAVTAALEREPAVLDWTDLDISGLLPGMATFRPPVGGSLPYADGTIDVVVLADRHALDEARRVASSAVVVVGTGESGGVEVRSVEHVGAGPRIGPAPLVWTAPGPPGWVDAVAERVTEAGGSLHVATLGAGGMDGPEADVVVLVEPGALPLPGAIKAASTLAAADPNVAVTGKVVDAAGWLESAGGMVFGDRSIGLIGHRSPDVSGPWHEYVRPVCFGSGVIAVSAELWRRVSPPPAVTDRAFLREWSGAVWAAGGSVRYDPSVAAVRVVADAGEPATPLEATVWQRVLDLRPPRPRDLSDGAWRYLLGHDDVTACGR